MSTLSLFLQFEGSRHIELIVLPAGATPEDVIEAALVLGFPESHRHEAHVFSDQLDHPLERGKALCDQGRKAKDRIHVHRCREIQVTLHFNHVTKHHAFQPVATIDRVKRWFVEALEMSPVDATEHVLQLTGTSDRPDPDVHIGSLISGHCTLNLTLVPRKRVEG